ncbi:hypothetical protein FIV42_18105 [Persicimonas caeni]|jgi:hypothetical protein|uniref:Uncharacterized protein n=1 Tax=Persicimonas caeni TaxID=2292766 RepID=A0A4Y6PWR8_PERCE|nr:hypothetical protein [Persicimonas caeni]QDG52579.1 hypothetical protein FIV42_18105 [Persicimonas caeni]QED33801.1 hypothetical protein FRD00_18100 [Persicimonas caeni]
MHEQLHSDDNLSVFLTIEDDDILRLELVSQDADACDLSIDDEVVVFMNDAPVDVQVEDATHAVAELGPADELEDQSFSVVLRVHEFFEGWDFGPQ